MPRLPYPPPQHIDSDTSVAFPPRQIQFRHPGYDPPCDTLFTLPGAGEGGSLHHETARLACALVASNRLDGFLSEDREGQEVLPADTEFQLVRGHYYFQVPKLGTTGLDPRYTIIPSFRHWSPEAVPDYWTACTIPPEPPHPMPRASAFDVAARDISCRMTQHKESTEIAHLIPTSETTWFNSRAMWTYANINGRGNAILLRSDVHTLFDAKNFAIVPLRTGNTSRLLQPVYGIPLEILWARFAYTIFDGIKMFLEGGKKRWLKVRGDDGVQEDRLCDPDQCRSYAARTRSTSPQKRVRAETSAPGDDEQIFRKRRHDSSSSLDSLATSAAAEAAGFVREERGRKRRRSCSSGALATNDSETLTWASVTESTEVKSWTPHDGTLAPKEQQETSSTSHANGLPSTGLDLNATYVFLSP